MQESKQNPFSHLLHYWEEYKTQLHFITVIWESPRPRVRTRELTVQYLEPDITHCTWVSVLLSLHMRC